MVTKRKNVRKLDSNMTFGDFFEKYKCSLTFEMVKDLLSINSKVKEIISENKSIPISSKIDNSKNICKKYETLSTTTYVYAKSNTPYTFYVYDPKSNTREYGEQLGYVVNLELPKIYSSQKENIKDPDKVTKMNVAEKLNRGEYIKLLDGRYLCRTVDFDDFFKNGELK